MSQLNHPLHGWGGVLGAGATSVVLMAIEEAPGVLADAPFMLKILIWSGILVSTLVGAILSVQKLVGDSNKRTAKTIETLGANTAEALRREVALIRTELTSKSNATGEVASKLAYLTAKVVEQGDMHDDLLATANQLGEHGHRLNKLEKDVHFLHEWRRGIEDWRTKADALLEAWKKKWRAQLEPEERTKP